MFQSLTGLAMERDDWRLIILAGVACAIAVAASVLIRRRSKNERLLALALNNMTQGVVMFNAAGRLVVCDDQYLKIYALSPDIVKPGAKLI
jgi:PAS domain-containing protein